MIDTGKRPPPTLVQIFSSGSRLQEGAQSDERNFRGSIKVNSPRAKASLVVDWPKSKRSRAPSASCGKGQPDDENWATLRRGWASEGLTPTAFSGSGAVTGASDGAVSGLLAPVTLGDGSGRKQLDVSSPARSGETLRSSDFGEGGAVLDDARDRSTLRFEDGLVCRGGLAYTLDESDLRRCSSRRMGPS